MELHVQIYFNGHVQIYFNYISNGSMLVNVIVNMVIQVNMVRVVYTQFDSFVVDNI